MKTSKNLLLATEQATIDFGKKLAKVIIADQDKKIIYLHGNLGAGKTTLVKGFLLGCGYNGMVKSPTYAIVEQYETPTIPVFHFDLYRLSTPEELEFIGIRDYLNQQAICLFEWPQKGIGYLPEADINIYLKFVNLANQASHTIQGRIILIDSNENKLL